LVKLDIQGTYKRFFIGYSLRYNSYMHNIDKVFEANLFGTEVLPGLLNYRSSNETGSLVMDARIGCQFKSKYSVNILVNNFLNEEYSSRPGDIQPPRQFLVQLQYGI
jgi:iron complex outermembrane receptor protein